MFGVAQGTKFGEANFPQPRFDVYLDNTLETTLKGTETNTTVVEGVPAGTHKITVVALSVSGEIIDRKEVTVTTSPTVVVEAAPAPLPKTASSAPRMALLGLTLVAAGLLVGRKAS